MKIMLEVEIENGQQWEDIQAAVIDQEIFTLEPAGDYTDSDTQVRIGRVTYLYISA